MIFFFRNFFYSLLILDSKYFALINSLDTKIKKVLKTHDANLSG